jgi:DNA primase
MDFVDQLKSQLDIVDVVGHYVRLKRNGASPRHVGLCPFHTEKTPSFGVHRVHQFYKCFGCDAKGDLIKFVMEIEGTTFWESLKLLSDRYGIPMPQRQRPDDPEARSRDALFEMHEIAARTFEENLNGPAGADARGYLERRGVSAEASREFRLGLADARGQQLVQRLQRFGPELMEDSGLIAKRQESSGFYDRFRNRLMFPIHNESGKVIAFGGRALGPDDQPKYLNSPETKIYRKTFVLYNLHRAKAQARKLDRMILVEGYMDVIGIYQAGIQNVVASCGTSLTNEQVRSIKRQIAQTEANAGHVIVNFDPDAGGARGTERSIDLLLAEGLRVKICSLPGDVDPDEYIQQYGLEVPKRELDSYERKVNNAVPYHEWLTQVEKSRNDAKTPEGKMAILRSVLARLEHIHDPIEWRLTVNDVCARLDIDAKLVGEEFHKRLVPQKVIKRMESSSVLVPEFEKYILRGALEDLDARAAVMHFFSERGIPDWLLLRSIFEAMMTLSREVDLWDAALLSERLDPRAQILLSQVTFDDGSIGLSAVEQALGSLATLEQKERFRTASDLRRRIRDVENEGKLEEALRLADELQKMENEQRPKRNGPC